MNYNLIKVTGIWERVFILSLFLFLFKPCFSQEISKTSKINLSLFFQNYHYRFFPTINIGYKPIKKFLYIETGFGLDFGFFKYSNYRLGINAYVPFSFILNKKKENDKKFLLSIMPGVGYGYHFQPQYSTYYYDREYKHEAALLNLRFQLEQSKIGFFVEPNLLWMTYTKPISFPNEYLLKLKVGCIFNF